MALNLGAIAGAVAHALPIPGASLLPDDLTPGFNINAHAGGGIPFISKGNGSTGIAPTSLNTVSSSSDPKKVASDNSTPDPYTPGTAGPTAEEAANIGLYETQLGDLNSLLGRADTGLNQGLSSLNDSYQSNVNSQTSQKNQALQDYSDKRVQTNKDKLGAYDIAAKNANNGYRSLAQIIGRASGSGSSAFQDLLPDVVGRDLSSKRGEANQVYASNLGNIDTAQKKTEGSFAQILQDLANQRSSQEQQLRTGVEQNKQGILQNQQTLSAQLAAARGGNPAAAAGQFQPAIENSRNAVESFFNQFKPTVTAQQAAIAAPDLSQYEVDRSNVNAQQSGGDPTNPYADILRKRLQDQAA